MNSIADGTTTTSAEKLLEQLITLRVIPSDRGDSLLDQFRSVGLGTDCEALANFLMMAGQLTAFQAEKVFEGQASRLALGPYILLDLVGNGSFGQVYRAICRGKSGTFAVKLLPLRSMWNVIQAKKQVAAFRDLPVDTAIVPFVDIDTSGGSHYLVWPFVEGDTFDTIVRNNGALHPDHVVKWMCEILHGLSICHKAGIVHGLLKPGNLLLGRDRRAKILDLGIGAILSENISEDESMMDTISTSNTAMSTIDCSAPETLADPTKRTPAGDVYSFGCVMYHLLCGCYPFPDGNVVDKMIAHQTQEPVSPSIVNPEVPEALGRIVLTMLHKDPTKRPSQLKDLAADLLAAAPQSSRLTADDMPDPTPTNRQSGSGFFVQNQRPKSDSSSQLSHGETEDAVDFNIALTPKSEGRAAALPGRAPGLQDSAVVDYFTPISDPSPIPPPMVVPKAPIVGPKSSDDLPRQIVLPLQFGERVGKATVRPDKPLAAAAEQPVELPQTAVQWAELESLDEIELTLPPVFVPPPPPIGRSPLWNSVLRRLLFWRAPKDLVQFSLFGPTYLAPGQTYCFQVCAHIPEAFAGVRTLSRAFQADAELRAAGYGERLIRRGSVVGLHLALANAGVAQSMLRFQWVGQSKPWKFEVYVPWESPAGRTPGLLSVGLGTEAIAQIHFNVVVLHRSA